MVQPSKNKIVQVVLLIAVIFGLIVSIIAFLLNLLMKVGDGFSVALIAMLSSSISFLIILWIIQRGFKRFTKNSTQSFYDQANMQQNFFNQDKNK